MTATATREKPMPEGIVTMADVTLGSDLGDGSLAFFASLHNASNEATELIEVECHGRPRLATNGEKQSGRIPCETRERFKVMRVFSTSTACDACREAYLDDMRTAGCRSFWEAACPAGIRATDTKHEGFPANVFKSLLPYTGAESLFLYGPTRSGKTRTAAMLMKRALLAGRDIGFMWAEELKDAALSRDRLKLLRSYAARDVLMMDDAVLTGAQDEKVSSFLKDLIDMLIRNEHQFIITSQIGGEDYAEQADKFGNLTKADRERIAALWGRIREKCRVVPFAAGVAVTKETAF